MAGTGKKKNAFFKFCINGLEQMYIPDEHLFAASRRMRNGQICNVRGTFNTEYLFTMLSLNGLFQAKKQGLEIFLDVESTFNILAEKIDTTNKYSGEIASTLWTGRSIGVSIPSKALSLYHERIETAEKNEHISAKALAWLIISCALGGSEYKDHAEKLAKIAFDCYISSKHWLVREKLTGFRKDWAPFGHQVHMAYAFLMLGRLCQDNWAREIGIAIVRKLVSCQGPCGQWPYMFHIPTGNVSDFYPIYTLHQYGYAPLILVEAINQGYKEFKEPLSKGFRWFEGINEISKSLADPVHQIIWRRVKVVGNHTKTSILIRRVIASMLKLKPRTVLDAEKLFIDHECRGFELAIPLMAFNGIVDVDTIVTQKYI